MTRQQYEARIAELEQQKQAELVAHNATRVENQKQIQTYLNEITDRENKLQEANTKVTELETKIAEKEGELKIAKQDIKSEKTKYNNQDKYYKSELSKRDEQITAKDKKINELETQVRDKTSEITQHLEDLVKSQGSDKECRDKLGQINEEVKGLKQELTKLQNKDEQCADLQKKITGLESALQAEKQATAAANQAKARAEAAEQVAKTNFKTVDDARKKAEQGAVANANLYNAEKKEKEAKVLELNNLKTQYSELQKKFVASTRDKLPQYWSWDDYRAKFSQTAQQHFDKDHVSEEAFHNGYPSDKWGTYMKTHRFGLTLAEGTIKGMSIEFLLSIINNGAKDSITESDINACKKMIACMVQSMICRRQQNPESGSERCKKIPKGFYEYRNPFASTPVGISDVVLALSDNRYLRRGVQENPSGTFESNGHINFAGANQPIQQVKSRFYKEDWLKRENFGIYPIDTSDTNFKAGFGPVVCLFLRTYKTLGEAYEIPYFDSQGITSVTKTMTQSLKRMLTIWFTKIKLHEIDLDADVQR